SALPGLITQPRPGALLLRLGIMGADPSPTPPGGPQRARAARTAGPSCNFTSPSKEVGTCPVASAGPGPGPCACGPPFSIVCAR
ncbi:unnamed protein product, partial [Amoebophrya sp. A120]